MTLPQLNDVEARVLGALIEKEMATPEYYPLSLNALVNACNQKSNREPVVQYDDELVSASLELLEHKDLVRVTHSERVPKYGHRAHEILGLGNREVALLCVLLLRGPQTVGELKQRTERLHSFDDLDAVESGLRRLAGREGGSLAVQIKSAGMREPRWAHLLCGAPEVPAAAPAPPPAQDRIQRIEEAIAAIRERMLQLEAAIETLKSER